ncbi:D-alanyl-D-alanine carboxypeptidase family protein [uncultured Clostridium sp.]|uniref:D-alanyl-D-alanine carboxypeptidase family protein n=1 Tax=uncultured Clostridium sp. TaxID=59620 RepID=UPI002602816A|nr:D-alanyl-D-alanine carboxypeptidase family protein [uncultured Clostridium sp.]
MTKTNFFTKKNLLIKLIALLFIISLFLPFSLNASADPVSTKATNETTQTNEPNITGKFALTMDLKTGEIIYSKNADKKAYPASLTKLMTALLFAEHANKTDEIKFTEEASKQPPYSLHSNWPGVSIKVGQAMSAEDVMKALLMFSANDAAYMIADYVSGNSANFAKLMNEKAQELGMKDTHFVTANGLHNPEHYTTAYDLAILLKAAFNNPWVRETMEMQNSSIMINNKRVDLVNRNDGLGKDGNIAGKTGTTNDAGNCLASVYDRNGRQILGIVLFSNDMNTPDYRYKDMETIMNYSYNAKPSIFIEKGKSIKDVTLKYKLFGFFGPVKEVTAPITIDNDVMLYNNSFNVNHTQVHFNVNDESAWKATSKDSIDLTLVSGLYKTTIKGSLGISKFDLIKANVFIYLGVLICIVLIILIILFIIRAINKRRYKRTRYSNYRRRY